MHFRLILVLLCRYNQGPGISFCSLSELSLCYAGSLPGQLVFPSYSYSSLRVIPLVCCCSICEELGLYSLPFPCLLPYIPYIHSLLSTLPAHSTRRALCHCMPLHSSEHTYVCCKLIYVKISHNFGS